MPGWRRLCVISPGFCHPAQTSVFVALHSLIQPPSSLSSLNLLLQEPPLIHQAAGRTLHSIPLSALLSFTLLLSFFMKLYFLFLQVVFVLIISPASLLFLSYILFRVISPSVFQYMPLDLSLSPPHDSLPFSSSSSYLFTRLLYCPTDCLWSVSPSPPSRPCRRYRGSLMLLSTSSSWCCSSRSTTPSCRTWRPCNR